MKLGHDSVSYETNIKWWKVTVLKFWPLENDKNILAVK